MSPVANLDFEPVKDSVKADGRGRLTLGESGKDRRYNVFRNSSGQILLDPVVNIPEREVWLWRNEEALQAVQQGLEQATAGKTRSLGSFAEFAEIDFDDD